MAILQKNNAYSTLAGSLTNVATTLTVQTGHGDRFPIVASPDVAYITLEDASNNIEIVKITARANGSDSMAIVRSQESTAARAWNSADIVELRPTAGQMADKLSLTSNNAMVAAINGARVTVASHATTADIWAALGNQIDWTGTATTTIFPNAPQAGASRELICAGACSFTAGANMLIDGVTSGATVTCAAGDVVVVTAVSTTQFKLRLNRYDGKPWHNGFTLTMTGNVTFSGAYAVGFSIPGAYTYTFPSSTSSLSILGAETWTGSKTLGENTAIILDAALSADGKYTGIVQAGTAAAALAFGELCYKVTASGKWNKASGAAAGVGTVVATGQLGICVLAAAGDASATTMLMYGNIRADALFDTFTVGAPLYMSAATAGKIVSAAPSGTTDFTVRKVGMAEDGNTILFSPSNDYITLA